MMYEIIPDVHPYKHYRFLNIDGDSALEIDAADIEIKDMVNN